MRNPRRPGKETREKAGARPSKEPGTEPGTERLHKVMAGAGLGSRRSLETQIAEGAVLVNSKKVELGRSVKPGDRIQFRDQEWQVIAATAQHRTLIYNKPEGEVTTRNDPDGRPTVFDRMPQVETARWVTVGRLDINTTGLLLLTTDGELANAMMHPSNQVDREYVCRIRGMVSDEQVAQLREGVQLDDGLARFSDIQRMPTATGNQWFQITLLEGRNREVRRLWESVGCMVSRLKRVRYGAATLPKGLKVGRWSEVTPRDHRVLRNDVKLPVVAAPLTLEAVRERGKAGRKHGSGRAPTPPARTHKSAQHDGRRVVPPTRSAPRAAKPAATRSARPGSKPGSPAGPGRRAPSRSKKTGH
ncbi:MAG: pseudouridine synthase [Xanthomonadales bacterium]|nr:pseudouridine synthase [Xanthomonadales bacterium]